MNTRLPPPAVLLIAAALVWLIDRSLPALRVSIPGLDVAAGLLVIASIVLMGMAAVRFAARHTTINPIHPERASHLIVGGAYAYSRNPIYLGDALLLVAWILWLGNPAGLIMAAVFVVFITRFQIRPEERALATRFGERYRAYCRGVRRWI
ncbi:methyltransferase family protein [Spiribacter vilamensis]|uniref:Protein-S-isoprenylcysteine O-methyltransferase Ste14 n=1 Tax=Spiribacter vilamensis TaxID=531306 RepID=A0A4Q8CZ87_9GAMM|nr:isoprenylcysteine carboxylmethyltransferase family protein [Spiribacter vilamensis]RZU98272.1 protein-S-isoprenylcysteine O-methyltransferase Ste14 [Spiribacter vilamensis]TVO60834.1 isoprenylcysteine carboxylmethyltransferase family protein [Spiribacter vilamensis]